MIYAKLEANAITNGKILRATPQAFGVFCKSLCYGVLNLTDGFIPESALPLLCINSADQKKIVDELIALELWEPAQGGFAIHGGSENWARHQTTKDQVETQREQSRQRAKKSRESKPCANVTRNRAQTSRATHKKRAQPESESESESESDTKKKGETESAPPNSFEDQIHKEEYNPVRDQANELAELFANKAIPKTPLEKIPTVALAIAEKLRVYGLGTAERIREIIKDEKRDRTLPIAFVLQSLDRKPPKQFKTKEEMHAEIFGNQQPKRNPREMTHEQIIELRKQQDQIDAERKLEREKQAEIQRITESIGAP